MLGRWSRPTSQLHLYHDYGFYWCALLLLPRSSPAAAAAAHVIVGSAPFLSSRRELARLEVSEVWAGTPVPVDYPCIDGRPLFQQLPRQPSQRSRPAPHAKEKFFSEFFSTTG